MAEFCLKCWNKLHGTNDPPSKYRISKEVDFCEGCGEWKPVVIMERIDYYYYRRFRFLTLPIEILAKIIIVIVKLPYVLFKLYKMSQEHKKGKV